MKLKVCGMKYQDNINAVAALHPHYMGFIFYNKSSRYIDGAIPILPKHIKKVGVFVDAPLQDILAVIDTHQLDAVQLHGNESPEYCTTITGVSRIKAFSVGDDFNFERLHPYENAVDFYLFDTKGKHPGGNGITFNWNILEQYPSTKPYFLSGGIGLEEVEQLNVFKKSAASHYCYAIDVNSKFETTPGLKHINNLKTFKQELHI